MCKMKKKDSGKCVKSDKKGRGLSKCSDSVFDVFDILDDVLCTVLDVIGEDDIGCSMFIIGPSGTVKKIGIPTNDRISIPKRIVKECRKSIPEKKTAKSASLTNAEKKTIMLLRKDGLTVKEIARQIHRRDRLVGSFIAGKLK